MRYYVNDPEHGPALYSEDWEARREFDALVERLRERSTDGWHEHAASACWGELVPRQWLCLRVIARASDDTTEGEKCRREGWDYMAEGDVVDVEAPAPPVEGDPFTEGYAAGRLEERAAVVAWLRAAPAARLWRQEPMDAAADALCRGEHVHAPAPDPTADRAQIAALGAAARP